MYQTVTINGKEVCIKKGDAVSIPLDPENTDYQAYLAWVAEGNTAEEWQPEN
jgi:hypothetical protein